MTKKKKKYYSAPLIESVGLDREVSLAMASLPGNAGPEDPFSTKAAPVSAPPFPKAPSSNPYPFGGDTPDFSNM
ncbi:hypothetical protein DMA11_01185 [Marinilabiliaceae bacterium JC017]|nr:hypothetical protein DMA11_01185 [Marinilabiliaceae bacterium JC017]